MESLLEETSWPAGGNHYQDDVQQPYRFLRNNLATGMVLAIVFCVSFRSSWSIEKVGIEFR